MVDINFLGNLRGINYTDSQFSGHGTLLPAKILGRVSQSPPELLMLSIKREPDGFIHDRYGNMGNKEDTIVIHCEVVVNGRIQMLQR